MVGKQGTHLITKGHKTSHLKHTQNKQKGYAMHSMLSTQWEEEKKGSADFPHGQLQWHTGYNTSK